MFDRTKYDEDEFMKVVMSSTSVAEVLSKLGLKPAGGNYALFYKRVKAMNLSITHFTGQSHQKNVGKFYPKVSHDDVFKLDSNFLSGHAIKKRILNYHLKVYCCDICNISDVWNNKPLVLHLDHINGVHNDNRLENLRFLCPNCHSQTDTYAGKNKGKSLKM